MGYNGGYGGGYGGYGGFGGCGGYQPCCGYEEPKRGNSFALLVVLFILLIIIGSQFHKKC